MGICLGLQESVGICRDLPVFVGICGGLWGSAGICLASRSKTFCNLVVGPSVCTCPTAISPGQNCLQDWSYPQAGRTAQLRTLGGRACVDQNKEYNRTPPGIGNDSQECVMTAGVGKDGWGWVMTVGEWGRTTKA